MTRNLRRTAIIVAIYSVARFAADVLSQGRGDAHTLWYLGAALDVLLFLTCGWLWWPYCLVMGALDQLIFPSGFHASLLQNVTAEAPSELIYALATQFVVVRLRVEFPLRTVRDVWLFALCLGLIAPAAAGFAGDLVYWAMRAPVSMGFAELFAGLVTEDASAILILVPSVMQVLAWRDVRPEAIADESDRRELIAGLLVTFLIVIAAHVFGNRVGRSLLDASFVPLAWLAFRHGMRGALSGISVVYITSAAISFFFSPAHADQVGQQAYLVTIALMALLLGAVTGERNSLLVRLERRAFVDELTSLPNRERLLAWIRQNRESALVLVMLDIDDMRLLNEGVGRVAADRVLQQFASRLRAGLPTSHFVARVSSDEFAIALVDDRSPHAVINEVRELLVLPFEIEGSRIFLEASIGAVRMVRTGNVDELLRRADIALYRAKRTPSRSVVYTPDLQSPSVPSLVVELHRAVERGELIPFFQPIYRYDRANARWRIAGAEALLRWIHPQRGVLSPIEFIDLLERLTIGDRVGWNVMETSLNYAMSWRRFIPDFRVWVNLFERQTLSGSCGQRVRELLERTESDPASLVIEISERIVASDEREVALLAQQLRTIGVMTAIDDFGTGGSSLGRIRDVPAQVLKIDRSFVTRSEVDVKAKAVATTIVRLASELGMAVVAEGVENTLQMDAMLEAGCEYAQGYLLAHPMPAELFERLIVESVA